MKLASLFLFAVALFGAVMAQPATTPPARWTMPMPPMPTPPRVPIPTFMLNITELLNDPVIIEYIKNATALYSKTIIDYYRQHPERLRIDLSMMTSAEFDAFVPPSIISEFNLDRDEIESQLRANDERVMETSDEDEMEIAAIPSQTADDRDRAHPSTFDAQIGKGGLGLGLGLRLGLGYGGLGLGYGGLGLGYGGLGLGYGGLGLGYGGLGLGYGGLGLGGIGLGYPILGGGLGWGGLGYPGIGLGIGFGYGGLGLGVI